MHPIRRARFQMHEVYRQSFTTTPPDWSISGRSEIVVDAGNEYLKVAVEPGNEERLSFHFDEWLDSQTLEISARVRLSDGTGRAPDLDFTMVVLTRDLDRRSSRTILQRWGKAGDEVWDLGVSPNLAMLPEMPENRGWRNTTVRIADLGATIESAIDGFEVSRDAKMPTPRVLERIDVLVKSNGSVPQYFQIDEFSIRRAYHGPRNPNWGSAH